MGGVRRIVTGHRGDGRAIPWGDLPSIDAIGPSRGRDTDAPAVRPHVQAGQEADLVAKAAERLDEPQMKPARWRPRPPGGGERAVFAFKGGEGGEAIDAVLNVSVHDASP